MHKGMGTGIRFINFHLCFWRGVGTLIAGKLSTLSLLINSKGNRHGKPTTEIAEKKGE